MPSAAQSPVTDHAGVVHGRLRRRRLASSRSRLPPGGADLVSFVAALDGAGSSRFPRRAASTALDVLDEPLVGPLADHLDDLVAQLEVDGLDARRRRRGRRCTTSGTRARRRPSRAASTRAASRSPGPTRRCVSTRRSGSCQHTSGFQSRGRSPASSAARCSAQPAPPGKSGRLRKMQASPTRRVTSVPSPLRRIGPPSPHGGPPVLPLLVGQPVGVAERGCWRRPRRRSGRRSCSSPAPCRWRRR